MSVNDSRGPSIDSLTTRAKGATKAKSNDKASGSGASSERLAHRGCNTQKGAIGAVVPWPEQLFVVDPAPVIASVDRLLRKGGREVMGRCPTLTDGNDAAAWLVDRLSRLRPGNSLSAAVEGVGGHFLLILHA